MRPWVLLFAGLALAPCALPQEKPATAESEEDKLDGWKWINFLILAGGLTYVVARNAGPFFKARTAEIQKGITDAGELRRDAEARAGVVELRLANLGVEIERLRGEAHAEFSAEGVRIQRETTALLTKIHRHAEHEIVSMGTAAREELKVHAARLALELAERRVRAGMSGVVQARLVDGFVERLGT